MTVTNQHRIAFPSSASLAVAHDPQAVVDVLVRGMRVEAEGVVSLEFARPNGKPFPEWQPGAHLDVLLDGSLLRQYSLCSQPGEPWRVAVLREPQSRGGSAYIHSSLRVGDLVGLRGPRNNFALDAAGRYRFLAGGIGITPILSMVRRAEEQGSEWTLDYLGRSRATMAFLGELASFGDRVRIHADDTDGGFDLSGHLAEPGPGTLAYACGPGGLLGVLAKAAQSWSDPSALRLERFAADASVRTGAGSRREAGTGAFIVELADGQEVAVPADRSILEALEDHGYAPPNSCREGICGTCETTVLGGDVDHRDTLLSAAEKEANETMMICVSRARGGCRLRLDLP